ncbi:hypothetical protein FH972_017242 [Carpinus fangiana]|uniref:Late embryogenesis abundant protein LEA-2 subgroup domain-containing protein n=1 Tax=Carpinus fangiana TaxID=176857 RepID=A0A5N6RKF0_9ROSI|nr:hypothetical protein FH972_017242 [Carpinus fangiana]
MEEKQTHLNGARHRPSLISKIVVTVLLGVVGPSVFVVLLILTPKSLKIQVEDAFLVQFNLTTDNYTLHYNLALDISIRNPNKRIGFYYDTIQANGYYDYHKFGTVSLTPFYQGHKNTSVLSPVFNGSQQFSFPESSKLIPKFNTDTSHGVYTIAVELNLSFRTKGGRWIKKGHFNPLINCDLEVPLSSNGKSAARSNNNECKLDS